MHGRYGTDRGEFRHRGAALLVAVAGVVGLVVGCGTSTDGSEAASEETPESSAAAVEETSLSLPDGFRAEVVTDGLGRARHLAVDGDGDVYVRLRELADGAGILALRDEDGDGRAERVEGFDDTTGTGIALRDGYLYFSSTREVYRRRFQGDELVPSGPRETVVEGFPNQAQHAAKSMAFDDSGGLYVNVGAPSNACQEESRTKGSPGMDPCPLLERHGGIWAFDADRTGQTQVDDGRRHATGIRNAVALTWNEETGSLYLVMHGRDQLAQLWPDLYTFEESAELPAEEFFRVDEGDEFGWPYCYYDHRSGEKVLAPEYGGDGQEVGRCDRFEDPIVAFPGHWGPNDVLFYGGGQFPDRYRHGAFIAFHGSWNRAPLPQQGYNVVFVPFEGGRPTGEWEVFADGFAGVETIRTPGDARYRPTGLAVGPEGALYVADSLRGRIWRIVHDGGE